MKDVFYSLYGPVGCRATKTFDAGEMGKGRLRPQIGDIHLLLGKSAGGDDFPEDTGKGLLRKFAVIFLKQSFKDLPFP